MNRSELNEAMARFFVKGGTVTKLPDGPDHRFQPYGVRVEQGDPKVDITALQEPANETQQKVVESSKL